MNRLKHSGFYKFKFLITPEEFKHVMKLFEQQQAQFNHTNYAQTKHDHKQVYEAYEKFYQYFTVREKPQYHPYFVYSISFAAGNESSGFFVRNENISFPYLGQWAEDELPSIMLSLPKGFQIILEDQKYYVYEDIREHQPITYSFYTDIVNDIKKITKPFRFFVHGADAVQEQKPPVRISKNAAADLMNAWIFRKYKLVMGGL
ncbi:hypothetical protein [Paenibacillus gorillae]|uniref:hypothetical protein n=1 Tax=Paenibacillus gorillae TaxID=1243662 RepID=UPI0004BAE751|nr:hypothetical protein [Paenibacillus gorillae]